MDVETRLFISKQLLLIVFIYVLGDSDLTFVKNV